MKYIVITLISITLLLIQSSLSKKRKTFFIFILPLITILSGLVYQAFFLHSIRLASLYPFLIAGGCLLLFGFVKLLENRKNELEHMKSQDL